jgi:hypothetical protein
LAFFSKTNVMVKFLHKLALIWVKNANFFAEFFGGIILKIITSVPGRASSRSPIISCRLSTNLFVSPNRRFCWSACQVSRQRVVTRQAVCLRTVTWSPVIKFECSGVWPPVVRILLHRQPASDYPCRHWLIL